MEEVLKMADGIKVVNQIKVADSTNKFNALFVRSLAMIMPSVGFEIKKPMLQNK